MQKALISIIRFNLNAAQAALDAVDSLEETAVITGSAQAACPKYTPCIPEPQAEATQPVALSPVRSDYERIMDELNDPRYTLRSFKELEGVLGLDSYNIRRALIDGEVGFVTRTRRRDGEELIGLASRN